MLSREKKKGLYMFVWAVVSPKYFWYILDERMDVGPTETEGQLCIFFDILGIKQYIKVI